MRRVLDGLLWGTGLWASLGIFGIIYKISSAWVYATLPFMQ